MHVRPLRTVSLAAAAAVAGASLTLLAAPAAMAAPPAGDTAISGVATIDGTPSGGIDVALYEATAPYDFVGFTTTDAAGAYYFDFTTGDANDPAGFTDTTSTASTFKLGFDDDRDLTVDQIPARSEFFSDRYTVQGATPVSRPAPATNSALATVTLTSFTGVQGTPSVAGVPAGYLYYGSATFYDADGDYYDDASFDNDPASTSITETYKERFLLPGEDYTVRFFAYAYNPTTDDTISYVTKFYKSGFNTDDADVVTAAGPGVYLTGVEVALSNVFAPLEAPSIKGQVVKGKTVTADPGDWGFKAGNNFSYQWLVDEVPVAVGPAFVIPKDAKGKKVRLLVTNENTSSGAIIGTAASKALKVGFGSKLKAKAKRDRVLGGTNVEITGTLKVKASKKKAAKLAKGKVLIYDTLEDGTLDKVGKGRIVKGKLTATVKRLDLGKHELVVEFKGSKKVSGDIDTVKVKV